MGVFGIIWILAFHFIADFLLQSNEMAIKKSTSIRWLTEHVAIYAMVTTLLFMVVDLKSLLQIGRVDPTEWLIHASIFLAITFIAHWITDFLTSKWTTYLFKKKKRWKFFAVIGFDQFIHTSTLLLTYEYMLA